MIAIAKSLVQVCCPPLFYALKRRRARRQFCIGHGGAEYRATQALVRTYGKRVVTGPFAGMRYGDDAICSAYVAKLVGSYERELHGVLEQIIQAGYKRVVNVGCAEGYYAVGLAIRMPQSEVVAFDTDHTARRYCRDLAKLNDVCDRVDIRGLCNHESLAPLCGENTIIVCDCEGFEDELLDPLSTPELSKTDVLVELHDYLCPGLTSRIAGRFKATHDMRLIDASDRYTKDYPELDCIEPSDRPWAVREGRPAPMQWAFLTQNSGRAVGENL